MRVGIYVSLLLGAAGEALAWGSLGHRTVAYLAEKHMTPKALAYVNTILRGDDISDAAIWPDKYARTEAGRYSKTWHYVNGATSPPEKCGITATDCAPRGCVLSGVQNATATLLAPGVRAYTRKIGLSFLLHFIGDMHQPLHTEGLGYGGNLIDVRFDGHLTVLHSIWDSWMPKKYRKWPRGGLPPAGEQLLARQWAAELFATTDLGQTQCVNLTSTDECTVAWADATSRDIVCKVVFKGGVDAVENHELGGDYYEAAIPVMDEQIRKAGARLGAYVNAIAEVAPVPQAESWERLDM